MKLSEFDLLDTSCNVYLDTFLISVYIYCMWQDYVVNERKLYLRHECQEICVI